MCVYINIPQSLKYHTICSMQVIVSRYTRGSGHRASTSGHLATRHAGQRHRIDRMASYAPEVRRRRGRRRSAQRRDRGRRNWRHLRQNWGLVGSTPPSDPTRRTDRTFRGPLRNGVSFRGHVYFAADKRVYGHRRR